jgi:hypothetical protein
MSNKYHARRTSVDNITFDSAAEANRYAELLILLKAGEIKDLIVHPKYEIVPYMFINDKRYRAVFYEADFEYKTPDGKVFVEDVKGVETPLFKLKWRLANMLYPQFIFKIVRA